MCVCVRDQSASRDGVLGTGHLTCGVCFQKRHRGGRGPGCALDREAGLGEDEEQNIQKLEDFALGLGWTGSSPTSRESGRCLGLPTW